MATADDISGKVLQTLADGPYSCTSLARLSGGTANFVYRGTLSVPLLDGSQTIVIKHTESYVASNPAFKLTATRSDFEQTILTALHTLSPSTHSNTTIQTPHLYEFSSTNNKQICTDLPSSTELKTYVLTHSLSRLECTRLGESLGIWTRDFYSWAAAPEQEGLRETMRGNKAMMELKYQMNYLNLIAIINNFPGILEKSRKTFEEVMKDVRVGLDSGEGSLIHGDFWSGNVLLPNSPPPSPEQPLQLFIIDWELSHIGSIAFDLGQMFAELFELKHFKNIDAGVWLIEAFVSGYGKLEEDVAFKTAIHFGAHLICWGSRVQNWGSKEQIEAVVEVGRGFVVNGWERDRKWFGGTALNCLFG